MGNKQKKSNEKVEKNILEDKDSSIKTTNIQINRSHFEFLNIIGKGGFGKVWKVQIKKYKTFYAMKEMSKAKIIDKNSDRSIRWERELLGKINHPFIVNMKYAFQDTNNLYICLDYLSGGDMRFHISKQKKFNEEESKFFIACIILAIDYIHSSNILHRDIKPENLVLKGDGYLCLTDFGIAKYYQKSNSSETSGTPGYMAPEVMCALDHTIAVDYFALGVIAFEFMFGFRPYLGKSRKEIKEKIMAKQVVIKKNEIPDGWSIEAADFINRVSIFFF